ncbi:hypothetical protein M413DRAFT_446364 [Hebeloma cylindrosporum]|uniref:Uncharacterized protein n=1 Tax=Hebeloma cylindrosporum TaxID=76867 RepID=A0A0C3C9G3_HEBCY|nr:hypothetical protein M413DRAFT_446364 [Hebeloma cylindrosporum h7]
MVLDDLVFTSNGSRMMQALRRQEMSPYEGHGTRQIAHPPRFSPPITAYEGLFSLELYFCNGEA